MQAYCQRKRGRVLTGLFEQAGSRLCIAERIGRKVVVRPGHLLNCRRGHVRAAANDDAHVERANWTLGASPRLRVNGSLEMTGGGRLVCPLAAGD
jgi:hypothetical protein